MAAVQLRLDLIPNVSMAEVIRIGDVAIGPFHELAPYVFRDRRSLKSAEQLARAHRSADGKVIANPTLAALVGATRLTIDSLPEEVAAFENTVEAFRYVALLSNRLGYGPHSSHLHVERYVFRPGSAPILTVRTRFTRILGVRNPRFRAPLHLHVVSINKGQLDVALLSELHRFADLRRLRGRPLRQSRRLWRAIYWFNQAHHDDPLQPHEFPIVLLACAFEALTRPSSKIADLQAAVRRATGRDDFDDWVEKFYKSRSAIVHGDPTWSPLYGASSHIDHYRVATRVFPMLVSQWLEEIQARPSSHPLVRSMEAGAVARLVHPDSELIASMTSHTFSSLKLRRNAWPAFQVKVLPVLLNEEDRSTSLVDYQSMADWLRSLGTSVATSGMSRFRADADRYVELRRQLRSGPASLSSVFVAAPGEDLDAIINRGMDLPEHRPLLGDLSLTDISEAIQAVETRIEMVRYRDATTRMP